jgi:DNA polymerase III delta prime subunit
MSILQLLGIRSTNTGNPNRDNQILWYNKYNNRLVGLKGAKKEFLAWLSEPLSAGPLFVEGPSGCGKTRMVLTCLASEQKEFKIICQEVRQKNFLETLPDLPQGLVLLVEDYDMANDSANFNEFIMLTQKNLKLCILGHKLPKSLRMKSLKIERPEHENFVRVLKDICTREKINPDLANIISTSNYDYRSAITILQSGFAGVKDERVLLEDKLLLLPMLSIAEMFHVTDMFFMLMLQENYLNCKNLEAIARIADTISYVETITHTGIVGYEGLVACDIQNEDISFEQVASSIFSNKTSIIYQHAKKNVKDIDKANWWMLSNVCHNYILKKQWIPLQKFVMNNMSSFNLDWYDIYKLGRIKHIKLSIATRNKIK